MQYENKVSEEEVIDTDNYLNYNDGSGNRFHIGFLKNPPACHVLPYLAAKIQKIFQIWKLFCNVC